QAAVVGQAVGPPRRARVEEEARALHRGAGDHHDARGLLVQLALLVDVHHALRPAVWTDLHAPGHALRPDLDAAGVEREGHQRAVGAGLRPGLATVAAAEDAVDAASPATVRAAGDAAGGGVRVHADLLPRAVDLLRDRVLLERRQGIGLPPGLGPGMVGHDARDADLLLGLL